MKGKAGEKKARTDLKQVLSSIHDQYVDRIEKSEERLRGNINGINDDVVKLKKGLEEEIPLGLRRMGEEMQDLTHSAEDACKKAREEIAGLKADADHLHKTSIEQVEGLVKSSESYHKTAKTHIEMIAGNTKRHSMITTENVKTAKQHADRCEDIVNGVQETSETLDKRKKLQMVVLVVQIILAGISVAGIFTNG